ncbi:prepilin-type N-terminal cleavage/methylation domain-containing protein [Caloramator quimbayensis]|uniref:Prepilin-type N-terminal cleavage/methylation domain-containing protein n=1 Tax=Caloramator quimbayensis TaxID=1147123 RepID=A0A1T4WY60_9CLOT|nr:prepilin-type N-terminal cleavage/methylation domain-containing protein [Caloramator quimbayensis]SKA82189.1 prepilin-type N-terminal cleavage/methylation domain-containing protein [Caloramator quimbayensis]
MKKGFILIEMAIVVAILGILLSISYINFTRLSVKSNVDSKADEIASMLRDTYENGNKEMNFKDYYIEIIKNGNSFEVSLISHKNSVRKTDLKDFELNIVGQTFESSPKYIYFSPNGEVFLSNEKIEEGYDYNIDDKKFSDIVIKKGEKISKKIHIDDMPLGNITVD